MQISHIYKERGSLTAQVVYPCPPRTTVRSYALEEALRWRPASDADVARYEKAWGLDPL